MKQIANDSANTGRCTAARAAGVWAGGAARNWPSCSATDCRAAWGSGSAVAMLQVPEVAEGIRPHALAVGGGQVHVRGQPGAVPRVVDGDQARGGRAVQDDHV